jgi:hypothetical protein
MIPQSLLTAELNYPVEKSKGEENKSGSANQQLRSPKKKLVWDPTAIRWINYLRPDLKPGSFSLPPTRPRNSCTDLKERNRLTSMLSTGSMGVLVGECK